MISNDDVSPERRRTATSMRFTRMDTALLVAVLLFYAVTRLFAIADFPIFFFCDEATQANLAQELVDHGFRDNEGNLFPAYFRNVKVFNLGLSVWMNVPTTVIFGKSIAGVRATSVAVGVLGAAALMLALKFGFKARLWWLGGLVLAALPGWFLHSRTAFETAMMVGFYACFVCAYLLYRKHSPRWLPAAIIFGGATFYSYSNGQGVMFVTLMLLLVTDWRYHWGVLKKNRWVVAGALVTAILVAGPFVRFRYVLHPEMMDDHLEDLQSYWVTDIPTAEKLGHFARTYAWGLSPVYWFFEDINEFARHRMSGYGYLPLWLSPFIALGALIALIKGRRSAAHRLVLIAILAAPFSASIVGIRITRVLSMMVPATMLAVIGLEWIRERTARFVPEKLFATLTALIMVAATSAMTVDALTNGPTWYRDYQMGGMQWGAKELYGEIRIALENDPEIRFVVSHAWANWPDAFPVFFLEEPLNHRVRMGVISEYIVEYRPHEMSPKQLFVMTPGEFDLARENPMIDVSEPLRVIPYPDGEPGFRIVRAAYSPEARSLFEAERLKRRQPVQSTFELDGIRVRAIHPKFDDGNINSIFDGDFKSIARTLDADPCVLVFRFAKERPVSGVVVTIWSPEYGLGLRVVDRDEHTTLEQTEVRHKEGFTTFELRLEEPVAAATEVSIIIDKHGDNKVHIQEIEISP